MQGIGGGAEWRMAKDDMQAWAQQKKKVAFPKLSGKETSMKALQGSV